MLSLFKYHVGSTGRRLLQRASKSTAVEVKNHFLPVTESDITKELLVRFNNDIRRSLNCDVIVIGSGLSGLSCAYHLLALTEKDNLSPRLKITLIDKSLSPGGSGWTGSGSFNAVVVRKPAHNLLDDLGVYYEDNHDNYVVCPNGVELTSKLLSNIAANRNVIMLNGYQVEEVMIENANDAFSHVRGVACDMVGDKGSDGTFNPTQFSPLFFNSRVIVSACGHHPTQDGGLRQSLKRFSNFGMPETVSYPNPPHASTDIRESEDYMVHNTREVSTGLIVAGTQIAWLDGTAQSGPTVAGPLHSGLKAAELALNAVLREREKKETIGLGYEAAGHFLHDDSLGHTKDPDPSKPIYPSSPTEPHVPTM